MNKKNLLMGLAATALIASAGIGAVGCNKAPALELKLDGAESGTVKAGGSYEVKFSLKGFDDFTYTITGDNADFASFDKDTKQFTAEKAGTYVLTISAVKGDTKKEITVTVTVTAAGDNTALLAEIAKTEDLVESDYTSATWNDLKDALNDAREIAGEATAEQTDLDAAKDVLTEAIDGLKAVALKRAVIAADETTISYNGVTYNEAAYFNFAAFLTGVKALNGTESVKLNSVYSAQFAALVSELEARIKLTVEGLYNTGDGVVTIADNTVKFTVAADQGADAKVYRVQGGTKNEIVAVNGVYTVTPEWDTTCTVRIEAQKGSDEASLVTKDYVFKMHALDLAVRDGKHGGGTDMTKLIKVENNEITTLGSTPFQGDSFNSQAYIDTMDIEGEFTARMTINYNGKWDDNNNNVVWIGMSKANSGTDVDWNGYACARYGAGGSDQLEICSRGPANKIRGSFDSNISMAEGSKITYEYSRKAVYDTDGALSAWEYSFSAIDPATGKLAGTVASTVTKAGHPYDIEGASRVRISFGFENIKATIGDISVVSQKIYDKLPLGSLIKNAEAGQYLESDYTTASWDAFTQATEDAWKAMNNFKSEQSAIDAAAEKLEQAIEGLTSIDLSAVIAQIDADNGSWMYGGETYDGNSYQDVKLSEIEALNARTATDYDGADKIVLLSRYDEEIQKIIATLVKAVEFDVVGLETQTYVGESFAPITFTVASTEADSIVVKDNGAELTAGESGGYTLAYTESGKHEIEITATKGDKVSKRAYAVEYYRAGFAANHDAITVESGKITMTDNTQNWDSGYNVAIKACNKDIVYTGDFRVQFDATPLTKKEGDDAWVVAFQAFKGDRWNAAGEYAIRYKDNRIAVHGGNGAEIASADLLKLGTKTTFVVERKGTTGTFYILGENGEKIGLAERGDMFDGALMLGWNFEFITASVENIRITAESGTVVDKSALRVAYEEASKLEMSDYASGWQTFAVARIQAKNKLDKMGDTADTVVTQAEIDNALAMLKDAQEALVKLTYELATVTETEFAYEGKTYKNTEWFGWAAVKEQIESLNALAGEMTATGYRDSVLAHIATMEIKVTVTGLDRYYYTSDAAGTVRFHVTAPEGTTLEVTAGSYVVTETNGDCSFEAAESGEVVITVKATGEDGSVTVTQTKTVEVQVGGIEIFRDDDTLIDYITPTADGFTMSKGTEWPGHNERKAYVGNVQAAGNFSYTADFTFNADMTPDDAGDACVATLHTGRLTGDPSPRRGIYLAIRYQQKDGVEALEIGGPSANARFNLAAEDLDCIKASGTIRATLMRKVSADKYVYTAIFTNPVTGKELGRKDWEVTDENLRKELEISQLSFNFERCGVTVGNILYTSDDVIDRAPLAAAIEAAKAITNASDELKTVLNTAIDVYGGDAVSGGVDKGSVRSKAELDALVGRLSKLVQTESIANVTYLSADGTTTVGWTKAEGATVTVALDGEEQTLEGEAFAYKPADSDKHVITVTATKDGQTVVRTLTVQNVTNFTVTAAVASKIEVTDGKIISKEGAGWDEGTNLKVKSGVKLSGDFRVEFDATVDDQRGDPRVIALQLGAGDQRGEFAIRYHNGRLALKQVEGGEVAALKDCVGKKYHFVAERIDRLGIFYMIDETGNVVGKTTFASMMEGEREIMFNFENIQATIENVQAFTIR